MSGSLDESTSKFHLNNDWTSSVEEGIKEILLNTWQEWGFEEIDEEFILFVMVNNLFLFKISYLANTDICSFVTYIFPGYD